MLLAYILYCSYSSILKSSILLPLNYNNEDLIVGLKEKDVSVFSIIYDNYAPALYGGIIREVNDVKIAEQILEKTFLAIWDNPVIQSRYNNHFLIWMISIAKSVTLETLSHISYINRKTEISKGQHQKRVLLVEDDENCIQLVEHIYLLMGLSYKHILPV